MMKNHAVLQTRERSPRAANWSEFLRRQNAAVALPFISIQVVLIELALDVVVPVVQKLVEEFVHRNPWRLAEIYRLSQMASNR
jgi:hypothetical protein